MSGNAVETSCDALGSLFAAIVNDMKDSWPAFEDLASKTTKLHSALRTTILAASSFLDSFQRVADVATNARGATKDIGKALTRLCMRQKSIESKMKVFTNALSEGLVGPMQEKMEDWKRSVAQLDKDHARDQKKAWLEIKKASTEKSRLQKKAKKGKTTYSKGEAHEKLDSATQNLCNKFLLLEDVEKKGIRLALIEERQHYCHFITCIEPLVKAEVSLVSEAGHLQEILDSLCSQAADPDNLPEASERVLADLKGQDISLTYQDHATPPDSPTGLARSRMSSASSGDDDGSLASTSEADSAIGSSPKHASGLKLQIPRGSTGLVSVASQDSGFTSQDTLCYRPPSASAVGSAFLTGGAAGAAVSPTASDSVVFVNQDRKNLDASKSHHLEAGFRTNEDGQQTTLSLTSVSGCGTSACGSPQALQQAAFAPPGSLDWMPPADRPHTVSGAGSGHFSRPALQADTFMPPAQLTGKQSASAEHMAVTVARQDRITGGAATGLLLAPLQSSALAPQPLPLGMPPRPIRPNTSAGGSMRLVPPPPARSTKAKPIATPLVPPPAEPVYMNPQELPLHSGFGAAATTTSIRNDTTNDPTMDPAVASENEIRASMALADAIRELEESTAALEAYVEAPSNGSTGRDQPVVVHHSGYNVSSAPAGDRALAVDVIQLHHQRQQLQQHQQLASGGAVNDNAIGSNHRLQLSSSPALFSCASGQQQHATPSAVDYDALRSSQGEAVMTWAGQAVLRRPNLRPAPPARTSSAPVMSGEVPLVHSSSDGYDAASTSPADSASASGTPLFTGGAAEDSADSALPPPPSDADIVPPLPDTVPQFVPPPAEWRTGLEINTDFDDTLPPPPPPLLSPVPSLEGAALPLPPPPLTCAETRLPLSATSSPLPSPPPTHSMLQAHPGGGDVGPSANARPPSGERSACTKPQPPAVAQKPRNRGVPQQPVVFLSSTATSAGTGSQKVLSQAATTDGRQQQQLPWQRDESAAGSCKPAAPALSRLSATQISPDFVASLNAKLSGPTGPPMAVRGARDKSQRTSDVDETHAGAVSPPGSSGSNLPPNAQGPSAPGMHFRRVV